MLIEPTEVLNSLKYDEAELSTVTAMTIGAEAFLRIAGAYRESNDLSPVVVTSVVGFWMSNRESEYSDYKSAGDFPLGLNALITMLQLSEPDNAGDVSG